MKVRIGLLIGLSITLTLLFAGTATAQSNCKLVNAHISDYRLYTGEEAAEMCGPGEYSSCRILQFNGTLNGQVFLYGTSSDRPDFGDTAAYRGIGIFETKHGEIHTDFVGINFWPTYVAVGKYFNLEPHVLTGGTGRYEGASGVLRLDLTFLADGEMTGEICWPAEQNLLADPVQDLLQNVVLLLKRVDSAVIFNIGKNIDWTKGTQYTQIHDRVGGLRMIETDEEPVDWLSWSGMTMDLFKRLPSYKGWLRFQRERIRLRSEPDV